MTDAATGLIQGTLDILILEELAGAIVRLLDAER